MKFSIWFILNFVNHVNFYIYKFFHLHFNAEMRIFHRIPDLDLYQQMNTSNSVGAGGGMGHRPI